jgi:hypothetical protein
MGDDKRLCAYCGRPIPKNKKSTAQYCKAAHRVRACRERKKERAQEPPAASAIASEVHAQLLGMIRAHAPPSTIGYSIGRQPDGRTWEHCPPRRPGTLPYLRFDQLPPPEWAGSFVLFYWTRDLRPLEARHLPQGLSLPRR